MRQRILRLVGLLRQAGVRVSVAETLDALAAVPIVGVEKEELYAGLAATLLKDEADAPRFARAFEAVFAPKKDSGRRRERLRNDEGGGSESSGQERETRARAMPPQRARPETGHQPSGKADRGPGSAQVWRDRPGHRLKPDHSRRESRVAEPWQVGESKEFIETLARRFRTRLSRRLRRMKRGRLDFRRTLRASIAHGGAAVEMAFRGRRPKKLGLVALLDLSHSVASASELFLALLSPSSRYFRSFRCFAYVDRLCEVSFEGGQVVPHERLDLYARSDFGKVLGQFAEHHVRLLDANTLLVVLGDARNNRRPPRPDLLAGLSRRARCLLWLNPEPLWRWGTGDSVMSLYAEHCDAVLPCASIESLLAAVQSVVRFNRRPGLRS